MRRQSWFPILAEHFELKHSLINMMNSGQILDRLEKDNPHDHIRCPSLAQKRTPHSILTWEYLVSKFINEFLPPSRTTNLQNEISTFQQHFDESFHEAWDRYKDLLRACPHHGFTELHQLDTFYNALNPADQDSLNSAAGGNLLERRTQDVLTIIENKSKCLAADGNTFRDNIQGYVSAVRLTYNPGNTIANPEGELKAITTRSGLVLDGPSVPMPPLFINPEEDERAEETLTNPELAEYTIKEVNDDIFDPEGDIIENLLNLDKTKDLPPYHDNPLSGIPTPISEPVTKSSSSPTLTSIEESDLIWEEFEAYLTSDSFPPGNSNPSSPLPPFHNSLSGSTTSSLPSFSISETSDYSLKEFVDELAHFIFPPEINYLPFDVESDLREIEYLLNNDPIKEMDSILKDSVDSFDDNLVDTISKMFTDEHALDYSSPPLWDDYDDELLDLKTVNDNTYDDPFDSKEEKIKDSKILIDELDPPGSSDFLPSPKCDSVFYVDFSEVDALSSTNNEDKVFNPGILIHENLYEVTNCETMEKNVKKISISNASLILEDFNPPLYELPFQKEVPGIARIFEASRARGFVLRSQELHILSFILGIRYPNLID
ncbi:reverse transcriptase domain-containing protein [Tanacetum coccineum]